MLVVCGGGPSHSVPSIVGRPPDRVWNCISGTPFFPFLDQPAGLIRQTFFLLPKSARARCPSRAVHHGCRVASSSRENNDHQPPLVCMPERPSFVNEISMRARRFGFPPAVNAQNCCSSRLLRRSPPRPRVLSRPPRSGRCTSGVARSSKGEPPLTAEAIPPVSGGHVSRPVQLRRCRSAPPRWANGSILERTKPGKVSDSINRTSP